MNSYRSKFKNTSEPLIVANEQSRSGLSSLQSKTWLGKDPNPKRIYQFCLSSIFKSHIYQNCHQKGTLVDNFVNCFQKISITIKITWCGIFMVLINFIDACTYIEVFFFLKTKCLDQFTRTSNSIWSSEITNWTNLSATLGHHGIRPYNLTEHKDLLAFSYSISQTWSCSVWNHTSSPWMMDIESGVKASNNTYTWRCPG